VTELVYGIDLVQWQLRIAGGERLTIAQDDVRPRGWAIEGRIYAEDPANHMLPSTGAISRWSQPEGPGIRVDAGVESGSEVSVYYDPMLAKLIVYAADRAHAIARFDRALSEFEIGGVRANLPLLQWIARDQAFRSGETTTGFIAQRLDETIFARSAPPRNALLLCVAGILAGGAAPWRVGSTSLPLRLQSDGSVSEILADAAVEPGRWHLSGALDGVLHAGRSGSTVRARLEPDGTAVAGTIERRRAGAFEVQLDGRRHAFAFAAAPSVGTADAAQGGTLDGRVAAPMPGKIVKISVREGDRVAERDLLLVLEAMKMEHRIEASAAAQVKAVLVKEGEIVTGGAPLVELE
ncbi:MAG TPA: biotin/lipoyl-containing protein, partial [Candidatus Tumulicola sp.]|nr:biotin/lipoyl-containing protein [Candidatus Tumulicola sp.]